MLWMWELSVWTFIKEWFVALSSVLLRRIFEQEVMDVLILKLCAFNLLLLL
jgi:hypothetical protein